MTHLPAITDNASLRAYISLVMGIPVLTQDQEYDASTKSEQGDQEASKLLVTSHLKYVVKIARELDGYKLPLADLIQEGNIGLMKAVKGFKSTVGRRLSSFSYPWIRGEMLQYVTKNMKQVKLGVGKAEKKLFFNLSKHKQEPGPVSQQEANTIALALNVSPEQVIMMDGYINSNYVAFDTQLEEGYAPEQYLTQENAEPSKLLQNEEELRHQKDGLKAALASLNERERDVIQNRYLADNKTTLAVLSEKYSVSKERIRQIEALAMKKLKGKLT